MRSFPYYRRLRGYDRYRTSTVGWPNTMTRGRTKKKRGRSKRSNRKKQPVNRLQARARWKYYAGAGGTVAIIGLLVALGSGSNDSFSRGRNAEGKPSLRLGQALYGQHCASCHGANLEGQPNWRDGLPDGRYPAPPHDQTGHTWHHDDDFLFRTTKQGGQATAPAGFLSGMPAFEATLADDEIWSILAFIKSRWPADIAAAQASKNARRR